MKPKPKQANKPKIKKLVKKKPNKTESETSSSESSTSSYSNDSSEAVSLSELLAKVRTMDKKVKEGKVTPIIKNTFDNKLSEQKIDLENMEKQLTKEIDSNKAKTKNKQQKKMKAKRSHSLRPILPNSDAQLDAVSPKEKDPTLSDLRSLLKLQDKIKQPEYREEKRPVREDRHISGKNEPKPSRADLLKLINHLQQRRQPKFSDKVMTHPKKNIRGQDRRGGREFDQAYRRKSKCNECGILSQIMTPEVIGLVTQVAKLHLQKMIKELTNPDEAREQDFSEQQFYDEQIALDSDPELPELSDVAPQLSEVTQPEVIQVEVTQADVIEGTGVKSEVTDVEVIQAEVTQADVIKDTGVQAEVTDVEIIQAEVTQADVIQATGVQAEVTDDEVIQV